jgi:hypothetical protein
MVLKTGQKKIQYSTAKGIINGKFSAVNLSIFALVFFILGGYFLFYTKAASLTGDINNDGSVNITDLSLLISSYGQSGTACISNTSYTCDLNNDSAINILDLSILLSNYGQSGISSGLRPPPNPIYGVTVDDVANVSNILNSSTHLQHMPTTRIVFDASANVSDYNNAINQLQPASYLMGLLLDSSDEQALTASAEHTRVANYLSTYSSKIDIWEIGNEVNGNWTGPYTDVSNKIVDAYNQVHAIGGRTALTLYENSWASNNCGDGTSELTPQQFSSQYVPSSVRSGLNYVLLSWYPTQCGGLANVNVPATTIAAEFSALHTLYPNAQVGFGEIGLPNPATSANLSQAQSMVDYYYRLSSQINLPYYIGGYFWWYYYEDALPYTTKPLWQNINAGFGKY